MVETKGLDAKHEYPGPVGMRPTDSGIHICGDEGMEKLRDEIVAELSYGLACYDVQITGTAEKFIADRILAIPELRPDDASESMTGRRLDETIGELLREAFLGVEPEALVGATARPGYRTLVDGRFDLAAVGRLFLEKIREADARRAEGSPS